MDAFLMPLLAFISLGTLLAFAKAAIGLGFVIFVHELGHFLVAKACGVKCEKFYVGFDPPIKIGPFQLPRTLFKKQWGETEYGIGIIPLGGYVKMLGQDDNPANAAKEAERVRVESEGEKQAGDGGQYQLDPRSYPAKSVPQRLAIISAGVVMNLIFAVIFATVAYRLGVSYIPCVIGHTMPGDPAWQAGLQPGDKIIQMGDEGQPDENLRFTRDLRLNVFAAGVDNNLHLLVRRYEGGVEEIVVQPSASLKKQTGMPIIGVRNAHSLTLSKEMPVRPGSVADQAGEFRGDDTIVALEINGQRHPLQDAVQLHRLLAQHLEDPVSFVVRRAGTAGDEVTIPVDPQPLHDLGVSMQMGPIFSIRQNSPAARAGLKVGDVLVQIDGQNIDNPILLPYQLRGRDGETVTVQVRRDGELKEFELEVGSTLVLPSTARPGGPWAVDALGIAYLIESKVNAVESGSSAAEAGLQAGDELLSVQFLPAETSASDEPLVSDRVIELGRDNPSWPLVYELLQLVGPETEVKLMVRRGDEQLPISVHPQTLDQYFNPERGLLLAQMQAVRTAATWGEAVALGVRETQEGVGQVILVLRRIKDAFMNLGGPGTIAVAATMEASESLPRLLIFLTLLSANLAVVNFLPIPVLDGGHAMFLLYEGIFRRPVNERVAFGLTMIGFCFILGLMIFVIGLDVWRFTGLSG